jgi:hypothetical protein
MTLSLVLLAGVFLSIAFAQRYEATDQEMERLDRLEHLLASKATPFVLGTINALLVWWWFDWHRSPTAQIHDEAAYLLQAALFARGRWTGEAPPLPEFFTQMHVLTEPVLASKYPPGFSLLLTPFTAIGFPALGPMVLAAITGALVFLLARRTTGGMVALLTWVLWSSSSAILRYQASFLSQTATVALWLTTFYCVLEYRTHRRWWTLVAISLCLGTMVITRPVTALALTIPVAIVTLPAVWRARAWRPLGLAAAAGVTIVSLLPLQNRMTTGDWRLSPLVAYSAKYTPFDFPGFGYKPTRELAPLPPDLDSARTFLTEARRRHTLPALPATLGARAWHVTQDIFTGWRAPLLLFALLGILAMPAAGRFALIGSAALLVAYSFHAHWPFWSVYYFEGYPAIVFASAVGVWALADWILERQVPWQRPDRRYAAMGFRMRATLVALCAFMLIPATIVLPRYQAAWQRSITFQRRFAIALTLVEQESPRSIVFVDYGRNHNVHSSLVWNVPDLATAKTWIAYERGRDDLRLMRLAPDRRAYVFRADQGQLIRLPPLAELETTLKLRAQ